MHSSARVQPLYNLRRRYWVRSSAPDCIPPSQVPSGTLCLGITCARNTLILWQLSPAYYVASATRPWAPTRIGARAFQSRPLPEVASLTRLAGTSRLGYQRLDASSPCQRFGTNDSMPTAHGSGAAPTARCQRPMPTIRHQRLDANGPCQRPMPTVRHQRLDGPPRLDGRTRRPLDDHSSPIVGAAR